MSAYFWAFLHMFRKSSKWYNIVQQGSSNILKSMTILPQYWWSGTGCKLKQADMSKLLSWFTKASTSHTPSTCKNLSSPTKTPELGTLHHTQMEYQAEMMWRPVMCICSRSHIYGAICHSISGNVEKWHSYSLKSSQWHINKRKFEKLQMN